MTEKTMGAHFKLSADELQLEVFLMRDKTRSEYQKMLDRDAKTEKTEEAKRKAKYEKDRAAEERALRTERQKLDHTPPFVIPMSRQREADIQAEAQRRVDARNEAAAQAMRDAHRANQEAFIAKHREERLQREAAEREARKVAKTPELKRDFDRAR